MDVLTNLKAFLTVARTENFAAAARALGVAPSVITKRISQLEWRLKSPLFERTTRRVSLTASGQAFLPAAQRVVADAEDLFATPGAATGSLQGQIRIKAPASITAKLIGPVLESFQQRHPQVSLELIALDRAVNPAEEGFDIAFTLLPDAYAGVIEQPLCPMARGLYASPGYLRQHLALTHPRDLAQHSLLNFLPTGSVWMFEGAAGDIKIKVQPRLNTSEAQLLLSSAQAGHGVALLSAYLANPAVRKGTLVPVLPEYPMPGLWLKALVPNNRANVARVQGLVEHVRAALATFDFGPPTRPRARSRRAITRAAASR
jgi:DNA-binding transcriptional LysR family regulator